MWQSIARTAGRLGNPLEWSTVAKGILLCWGMIPVYSLYVAYCLAVLAFTPDGELFNHAGVRWALALLGLLTVGSLLIGAAGFWLREQWPEALGYQHLCVQFYAITMSLVGYLVGSLSIVVGVVLAGSAVVGFTVFHRRAVMAGMVSATTLILASSVASALGMLEYAPFLAADRLGGEDSLLWALTMILVFSAPHFLLLLALSSYVIYRWHQREREVRQLAIMDPLTGVANRRWIMDELERELERSRRHNLDLSVIMVDLDHFKAINDTHGHLVGDRVLKTAASVLSETVRMTDMVGRYGGEEFLILLPDTDREAAREVAERCRRHIAATRAVVGGDTGFAITASLGVGSQHGNERLHGDSLIGDADQALYQAKRGGRNRTVVSAG